MRIRKVRRIKYRLSNIHEEAGQHLSSYVNTCNSELLVAPSTLSDYLRVDSANTILFMDYESAVFLTRAIPTLLCVGRRFVSEQQAQYAHVLLHGCQDCDSAHPVGDFCL